MCSISREWTRAFGHLAATAPVFAGEWGGGARHLAWGRELLRYFDARSIGWAAWSWADWPTLVTDCRQCAYTPTPFGALIKDALRDGRV